LISIFSFLSSSDEVSTSYLTGRALDDGGGFPEYLYAKPFGCTMFSIEKDERLTPPSSSEDSDE
jgi:hypothetical protein